MLHQEPEDNSNEAMQQQVVTRAELFSLLIQNGRRADEAERTLTVAEELRSPVRVGEKYYLIVPDSLSDLSSHTFRGR